MLSLPVLGAVITTRLTVVTMMIANHGHITSQCMQEHMIAPGSARQVHLLLPDLRNRNWCG